MNAAGPVDAAKPVNAARPVDDKRPVDAMRTLDAARPVDPVIAEDAVETGGTVDHLPPSPTQIPQLDGVASDDDNLDLTSTVTPT